MADEQLVQGLVANTQGINGERAQSPTFYSASYANDALYHIMRVASSGKARLTYGINNESSVNVLMTLYGAFSEDSEITADDVFPIDDTGITGASGGGKAYEVCSDPFPYFYIRTLAGATGDAGTVSIYAALMAY